MATYNNNLRIKEIATGAEAGSWGTSTNTNLSLIGDALGYATEATFDTDGNKSVTVGNATTSPYRSMYVKVTSSATLSAARDLTIGPNTIKRVMFIENATTGGQSIVIKQGSGANVTIANGSVMCVYLDGAGAGAAVVSVFTDFVATDSVKIQKQSVGAFTPAVGADNLIIENSSDVGMTLMTANDATAKICFGHPSDPDEGMIRYTHDADDTMSFTAGLGFSFNKGNTVQATISSGGDLSILTANKGLILKSANGTSYRVTVSNAGALVVTAT